MTRFRQLHFGFCKDASTAEIGHLALCQVVLADGEPPDWIMLVPKGEGDDQKVIALDGRRFTNQSPQAIVDAFKADPRDIPIDWNHAEELKAPWGEESPAAGWIVAMEVRDGAVWGHVEWTPKGAESLSNREYRYISPALTVNEKTRAIEQILSAGLVNSPALDMPAVAHRRDRETRSRSAAARMEDTMDRNELIKKLGLAENASDEQIMDAIGKLQAGPAAELEEAKKELETTRAKLKDTETELANARSASPSLERYVPRSDFDAAVARAKSLEDEKKAGEQNAREKAVASAIDQAMQAGKIVPASKDQYVALCSTDEGFKQFQALVETLPTIGDPSPLETSRRPVPSGSTALSAEEKKIAATFGMTHEEYLKQREETIREQKGASEGVSA